MSAKRKPELRIGTSGYQYDEWRGLFYPADLPKRRWLAHYAAHFDTVEINNCFYRLPQPAVFDSWRQQALRGFCYALKFSRYATHMKRLRDPQEPLGRFLEGARRLGPFLGPILVQLPPRWKVNPERLQAFLQAAPRDCRWAVELRDPSWLCEEVYRLLSARGAALCIHDLIADHPRRITADWVYLRFHGIAYGGSYSASALRQEATRIRRYRRRGLDVFAYFNNDRGGHAVHNALELREMSGGEGQEKGGAGICMRHRHQGSGSREGF